MNSKLLDLARELAQLARYLGELANQPALTGVTSVSVTTARGTGRIQVRAYLGHALGGDRLNADDEASCIEALRSLAGQLDGRFRLSKPNEREDGSTFRALDVEIPIPGGAPLLAWADIAHTAAPPLF